MPVGRRSPTATIDLAAHAAIDLGGAVLEPSTLTLQGAHARATLEPRVMQLLVALADSAGSVMSRDALLQACWGGLVVGDDALHRAVAGARRALRESGATQLAIETIPRVGYRLLLAAEHACSDAPATGPETQPAAASSVAAAATAPPHITDIMAPADRSLPRRGLLVGAVLGATGLAAGGAWLLRRADAVPADVRALLAQGQQALRLAVPAATLQAAGFFEQAVQKAPRHASAWGQLALAQRQVAEFTDPDQLSQMLALTEASAAQALALDPWQPDALTARALMVPSFGQWMRMEELLQAVLDRNPEHLPALDAMALLLSSVGAVTAHYPLRLKTAEGDPFHAGYNFRSVYSHWMKGQIAAADRTAERGLELWPRHFAIWLARHSLFRYTGRAERALAMMDGADTQQLLAPALREALQASATALFTRTSADRAAARAVSLRQLELGGPVVAVGATLDLAALGDTALALDVTEAFLLERGPLMAGTAWQPGQAVHSDVRHRFTNHLFLPVTAPLRADPRFAQIVNDIGMAAYWTRSARQPDYLNGGARPVAQTPLPSSRG